MNGRNAPNVKRFIYDDLELGICFTDNKVDFIECIAGPFCENTKPTIYEQEAFALLAEDLVSLLSEKNNGAYYGRH
jgi:hypothetical protein